VRTRLFHLYYKADRSMGRLVAGLAAQVQDSSEVVGVNFPSDCW